MKKFEKGELVIAHASCDSRMEDLQMVVKSIGKKFVTCAFCYSIQDDGNYSLSTRTMRFNVDNFRDDEYGTYHLYHSVDEYKEEERKEELKRKLSNNLKFTSLSLDELLLFKEIHEMGIEEWKKKYMRDV